MHVRDDVVYLAQDGFLKNLLEGINKRFINNGGGHGPSAWLPREKCRSRSSDKRAPVIGGAETFTFGEKFSLYFIASSAQIRSSPETASRQRWVNLMNDNVLYRNRSNIAHHTPKATFWILRAINER